jgi:hypothetical protein
MTQRDEFEAHWASLASDDNDDPELIQHCHHAAWTAWKAALAQKEAQQEPVGYTNEYGMAYAVKWSGALPPRITLYTSQPDHRAVLDQALEALESTQDIRPSTAAECMDKVDAAIAAIRELAKDALRSPANEPAEPKHPWRTNGHATAAVSTQYTWLPIATAPKHLKCLLLNDASGVSTLAEYDGTLFWTDWAPLPARRTPS